jgi:uncharacterized membrane protein
MLKAPYTGKDENKKTFYHGLFNYGKRPTVKISDLEEKFYLTLDKIRKKYDNNKKGKNVFHARSLILRYVGWALSILSAFAVAYLWIEFMDSTAKNVLALVGFAICITAFILSFFIRQRTDNAHEILQKIEGFKMFLETAEKERLETLVEENPQYFYDILPYTYVLGISDKWVSNFKDIAIEPVSWYTSTQTFNNRTFYYSLSSAMNSTTRAMTSTPQAQSTGGFSSGGGFSGGGVGGGGGGSW